jgi:hypothetical protein
LARELRRLQPIFPRKVVTIRLLSACKCRKSHDEEAAGIGAAQPPAFSPPRWHAAPFRALSGKSVTCVICLTEMPFATLICSLIPTTGAVGPGRSGTCERVRLGNRRTTPLQRAGQRWQLTLGGRAPVLEKAITRPQPSQERGSSQEAVAARRNVSHTPRFPDLLVCPTSDSQPPCGSTPSRRCATPVTEQSGELRKTWGLLLFCAYGWARMHDERRG